MQRGENRAGAGGGTQAGGSQGRLAPPCTSGNWPRKAGTCCSAQSPCYQWPEGSAQCGRTPGADSSVLGPGYKTTPPWQTPENLITSLQLPAAAWLRVESPGGGGDLASPPTPLGTDSCCRLRVSAILPAEHEEGAVRLGPIAWGQSVTLLRIYKLEEAPFPQTGPWQAQGWQPPSGTREILGCPARPVPSSGHCPFQAGAEPKAQQHPVQLEGLLENALLPRGIFPTSGASPRTLAKSHPGDLDP